MRISHFSCVLCLEKGNSMRGRNDINDELIGKLINGQLSEEEQLTLDRWTAESDENRTVLEDLLQISKDCEQLTLMQSINSTEALGNVKRRIKKTTRFKQVLEVWQQIAAILVIPIMVLSVYQYSQLKSKPIAHEIAYNEVSTPYGVMSKLVLPDGTTVELNGRSKLRYPLAFAGNERTVELDGEAYFQVKTNPNQPFVVQCNDIEVEAVGTVFNVLEVSDLEVVTSLVEGKVNLNRQTAKGKEKLTSLLPGQSVKYNSANQQFTRLDDLDIDKYTAWREGKLIFRNDRFPEVLNQLSRRYNVQFDVNEDVQQSHAFTGTFVNKDLDQILSYIELTTPVEFEVALDKSDERKIIKVINK